VVNWQDACNECGAAHIAVSPVRVQMPVRIGLGHERQEVALGAIGDIVAEFVKGSVNLNVLFTLLARTRQSFGAGAATGRLATTSRPAPVFWSEASPPSRS